MKEIIRLYGVKFNLKKLKDPIVAKKYSQTLKAALPSYNTSIHHSWASLEHLLVEAAVQHLGLKERGPKEWITDEN